MNYELLKFNFNELKLNENIQINNEKLLLWIEEKIYNACRKEGIKIGKEDKYNSSSIYLNEKNLNKMELFIDPCIFLSYSPSLDNELSDDEVGIDLSNILVRDN